MNFRLLDDDVLVLVADVRKVAAREVPSLYPVSEQHAGRCAAEKEVLWAEKKDDI